MCKIFLIDCFTKILITRHVKNTCRNSLHRRLLDGSPRMSTLNATSPNESSQIDLSLSASMNGDHSSTLLPPGTSSLVLRRPSANTFVHLANTFFLYFFVIFALIIFSALHFFLVFNILFFSIISICLCLCVTRDYFHLIF